MRFFLAHTGSSDRAKSTSIEITAIFLASSFQNLSSNTLFKIIYPFKQPSQKPTLKDQLFITRISITHHPTRTQSIFTKMDNLASAFSNLNMEYQNQITQNNNPAICVFDQLANQMDTCYIGQNPPAPTLGAIPEQHQYVSEQQMQDNQSTNNMDTAMDTSPNPPNTPHQHPGNILHDIATLHKISQDISQHHCTTRLNISHSTVADLDKRAREVVEKQAYTDLEEGFEQVYGQNWVRMADAISGDAWMVENINGAVDGSMRRAWWAFAEKFVRLLEGRMGGIW